VSGTTHRVAVDQLEGEARDRAWAAVVASQPRFGCRTEGDVPGLYGREQAPQVR